MTTENVLLVIAAITGIIGMPIIQFIKTKFNVDGNWAVLIATGTSLVLGFLVALFGGQLVTSEPVTIDLVVESAGIVFTLATLFYKVLLGDKK